MAGRNTERFYAQIEDAIDEEEANGNVETLMPPARPWRKRGEWEMRAYLERDTQAQPPRDIFTYAARCMP